jgi:hypothetical protein
MSEKKAPARPRGRPKGRNHEAQLPERKAGHKSLTPQRIDFLQARELGMPVTRACEFAGVARETMSQWLKVAREHPEFVAEERRIQEANCRETNMTRTRVQNMILEAIEFAKLIGDPNAMIRGAAEINKMCGFYAPEKHILELGDNASRFRNRLEALPEDELLRIMDEDDALDVDFVELDENEGIDGEVVDDGGKRDAKEGKVP